VGERWNGLAFTVDDGKTDGVPGELRVKDFFFSSVPVRTSSADLRELEQDPPDGGDGPGLKPD